MKNRKIVVVAFLLVAVLLLGVGYAALTDTLTIIGNAHVDFDATNKDFDGKIYFSAAEATSSTGTGSTADVASFTADDATYTANKLAVKDEQSVFTFTIKNASDVDVVVSVNDTKLSGVANPSNSNSSKFTVDYEYPNGTTVAKNGGTITVVVTVTLIETVQSATAATFGIELTVTSVEPAVTDAPAVE